MLPQNRSVSAEFFYNAADSKSGDFWHPPRALAPRFAVTRGSAGSRLSSLEHHLTGHPKQIPQAIQTSATLMLTRLALAHTYLVMAESAMQPAQRDGCRCRTRRLLDVVLQSLAIPGDTRVACEWLAEIDRIELRLREIELWPEP